MVIVMAIAFMILAFQVLNPVFADGSPETSTSEIVQEETSEVLPESSGSNGRYISPSSCSFSSAAAN